MNENSTIPPHGPMCDKDTAATEGWKMFAYCFMATSSLVGNTLVCIVVYKNRNMRSTINYFIVNMAFSDLLFTISVIPRRISWLYSTSGRWFVEGLFGSFLCKFHSFIQDVSTAVSILSLVAIAFDRFHAVVYPMKVGMINSGKVRGVLLAATWLVGSMFHVPYFYAYKLQGTDGDIYCVINWGPNVDHSKALKAYFLVMSITLFIIPVAALAVFYSVIIATLKTLTFPGNQSVQDRQRVAKRNRNVVRMVVAVVIVFTGCWLPFNVSVYVHLFHWGPNIPCYAHTLMFCVLFLAYSNSYITPYLYFIFSANFRQGFRKIFCFPRRHLRSRARNRTFSRQVHVHTPANMNSILANNRDH